MLYFKRLQMSVFLLFSVACLQGCGANRVAPNKVAIGKAKHIGVFVWKGQPLYHRQAGSGTIGLGVSTANTLYSGMSGDLARKRTLIYNSGVYHAFQSAFLDHFAHLVPAAVTALDPNAYVYSGSGKKRRIDPLASAKACGDDAIIEATVWPSEFEFQMGAKMSTTNNFVEDNTVKVDIIMRRVTDKKTLWQASFSRESGGKFPDLARQVAKKAADSYRSSP